MARNPRALEHALETLLAPDARGRLLARGLARGMVWRDGVVPEGGPAFAADLTADLLDFGYGVLTLALELSDTNLNRPQAEGYETAEAFRVAAEAIESAARRGNPNDPDRGRHLVIASCAFHLAGFAARSYSLLTSTTAILNLSSAERALALLLRRQLSKLRDHTVAWFLAPEHQDERVATRLKNAEDEFGPDDAAVVAMTASYHRAVGMLDSALMLGDAQVYAAVVDLLEQLVDHAGQVGNVPIWWAAQLTRHIAYDLWGQSLHTLLPQGPGDGLPPQWNKWRRGFVDLLGARKRPEIDLWPSQIEAAARCVDTTDDLVVALPTSAGKTRIAELCILRTMAGGKRTVYVTPLRALSAQVEENLAHTFVPLGSTVTSLYGSAGATTLDAETLVSADIVVATPEKLDFALRQDPTVLDDVELIVLDEGHMIGSGSREIRYEVLIQRLLRRSDAARRRIVCLSAMFNPEDDFFTDFGNWLRNDEPRTSIHVRWRPTRQRLATLDWQRSAQTARLSFIDGEKPYVPRFFEAQRPQSRRSNPFPQNAAEHCIAAANAFARDGHNVLVYSPQRSQVEPLVSEFCKIRRQGYLDGVSPPQPEDLLVALAIGREWLGEKHPAVQGLPYGIGTHHGALPRPFLSAVEDLLNKKLLPVVVASPTLAQGIDLPCSVLLFRSLQRFDVQTGRMNTIPPSEFGNVLGRVGRAYVDLDGIAVYPIFKAGSEYASHLRDFEGLIKKSRGQRLISGLVILVLQIAERIRIMLGVSRSDFLEYVLNHREMWRDPGLESTDSDADGEVAEEVDRSVDDLLSDLDTAILSLVEQGDIRVEDLAAVLDDVLNGSLWTRTLAHADVPTRELGGEILTSRAEWIWNHTTSEQRKACFSSGLGSSAGVFLYDRLDDLVALLVEFQDAVSRDDGAAAGAVASAFASLVMTNPFFAQRKLPGDWESILSSWVGGVPFADILRGATGRTKPKVQAFVQDGVVFKLVWAVEAVRVQALARSHPRGEELGDGPALALTYGVPSIPAALLCQAGFASRSGALWATRSLDASFSDVSQMRAWLRVNETEMARPDFWESSDQHLLWERIRAVERVWRPAKWTRKSFAVHVVWEGHIPAAGQRVRLVMRDHREVLVCRLDLSPLGRAQLPVAVDGGWLDAVVLSDRRVEVHIFGP